MRILVIGVGGVGAAVAAVAKRRSFFDRIVFADRDINRAQRAVTTAEDSRFAAAGADASDPASVAKLAREVGADAVLNAVDPCFTLPVFHGAFDAGAVYLDMAMSLSHPHPARPYELYTTEPFSEPEVFEFPEGIGPVECVNVEHEEVVLVPRWIDCGRVTFKYGLGAEFINVLEVLHKVGLDSTEPMQVGDVAVAPRDVLAAALPDPATLGDRMTGKTCAGTFVTGRGKDGNPRATYLYHVVDNERCMREYAQQAVVLQTALNPVVALELLGGRLGRVRRARP